MRARTAVGIIISPYLERTLEYLVHPTLILVLLEQVYVQVPTVLLVVHSRTTICRTTGIQNIKQTFDRESTGMQEIPRVRS